MITGPLILTIGHSTRSIETFVELLEANGVRQVADIRTMPRSRHNPQFNRDVLPDTLRRVGISYTHIETLGGLRRSHRDSENTGWRNASFRGFADYMQTTEFENGLESLMEIGSLEQVVMMCAETVPWRCHRSLIADALTVRGFRVMHIISESPPRAHTLTPFAKVGGTHITYPAVD